jgi:hypothetical protein
MHKARRIALVVLYDVCVKARRSFVIHDIYMWISNVLVLTLTPYAPPLSLFLSCAFLQTVFSSCKPPVSIIALGLPATKKTILFNGISVSVQTNKAAKSITLVGLMGWCDQDYCGGKNKAEEVSTVTFVSTTESPQAIVARDPVRFLKLRVSHGFYGGGSNMIAGADNQLVAVGSGSQKPSLFFAIGDGTSSDLQEPTSAVNLAPLNGDWTSSQYTMPTFYDGTQYWLQCRCGPNIVLKSSLSQDLVLTFPSDNGMFTDNGLAYANGILWLRPNRDSMTTFKRFNLATQQYLSDFQVASTVAQSYYGSFTVSPNGSILYLASYDWDTNSVDILSISTATNQELSMVRGKVPAEFDISNDDVSICGVAITAKGVAVCLSNSWNDAKTMYVPIYAV